MLTGIKVGIKMVKGKIRAFGDFGSSPAQMEFDPDSGLYCKQYDIPYQVMSTGCKVKEADRLHLNLYFDPVRRGIDQQQIDIDVARQGEALKKMKSERQSADRDMLNHDFPYYKVVLTKNGHVKSYTLDENKRDEALEESGFFANLTHKLDISAPEALAEYKRRDEQEKYLVHIAAITSVHYKSFQAYNGLAALQRTLITT